MSQSVRITLIMVLKVTILCCWEKGLTKNTLSSRNWVGVISPQYGSSIINSQINTQQWKSKEAKSPIRSLLWTNSKSFLKSGNIKMNLFGSNSLKIWKLNIQISSSLIFAGHSFCLTTSLTTVFMENITALYSRFWVQIYWTLSSITNSTIKECLCGS